LGKTSESASSTVARGRWRPRILAIIAIGAIILGSVWSVVELREELAVRKSAGEARFLVDAGKFDEARVPLERWLKARPRSPEAYFLLARVMFAANLVEQAFTSLGKARSLGHPVREVDRQQAIFLSQLGQHQQAEPILRDLLVSSTTPDPEADEALAKCYFETFRLSEAEKVIQKWLRDAPRDIKPYLWKIELGRRVNSDAAVMLGYYKQAIEIDPEAPEPHIGLAELHLQQHRLDEAVAEYTIYSRLNPGSASVYLGLGLVALERGDEAEAIANLDKAIVLDPRDVRPLLERGKLELRKGRYQSALSYFDRAIQLEPGEPDPHYQRSIVLARLGLNDQAQAEQARTNQLREDKEYIKTLFTTMMDAPRDLAHQCQAARWLIDHGHPEEGVRWAEKVLAEQPHHPEANQILANYHHTKGNRGLANFYRMQADQH
jgi:tetratricopeptide (TPR) repeat protein